MSSSPARRRDASPSLVASAQEGSRVGGREIQRRFVRGSLILFAGSLLSTVNNAVAVILTARLLGPNQYGLYTIALILPGLLQLFMGLGVNSAVVRYAAFHSTAGDPGQAKRFTRNAVLFLTIFGAALAGLSFGTAETLSTAYLHRPDLAVYVQEASFAILGSAILQAATSAAIGWSRMGLASLAQVVQSVVKLLVTPFLILDGFGVAGAIGGHVASLLLAGFIVVALLHGSGLTRRPPGRGGFVEDVREMLRFGLPVFAGTLVSSLAVYYTTLILAAIATNEVVGFYQAAVNFTTIISLVSVAMASALFPAFSSLDGVKGDPATALKYAVKFGAFFTAPATLFLILTAGLLVRTFYGAEFAPSTPLLELMAASYLPVVFGYSVFPVFFNGFGKTRLSMFMYLTGAAVILVLAPVLAVYLRLGVDGLIFSLASSYVVSTVFGAVLAKRYMKAGFDVKSTVAMLISSCFSYLITSFMLSVKLPGALSLLLTMVFFFVTYITLAPLTRAVVESDLSVLESSLGEAKVVGTLVSWVIRYARFVASIGRRSS